MNWDEIANLTLGQLFQQFTYLGKGSSRYVFDIGNGYVVKCAKRKKHAYAQNDVEGKLYIETLTTQDKLYFCPVVYADSRILIMSKAIPISPLKNIPKEFLPKVKDFRKKLKEIAEGIDGGTPSDEFLASEFVEAERGSNLCELYLKLEHFRSNFDLLMGDMLKVTSWGLFRGDIVLIDYGCTRKGFRDMYQFAEKFVL